MSNQKGNVCSVTAPLLLVFSFFLSFFFFGSGSGIWSRKATEKRLPTKSVPHLPHPINGELCSQKLSRE